MKIMKTSLMYYLLAEGYGGTIKVLQPEVISKVKEFYGEEAVQRLESSGLYTREDEYGYVSYYLSGFNLSFNIFETMPGVVTDSELREYIAQYMKENGMWPTEKPLDEITRYSVDVVLPKFVEAGLLETSW